MHFFILFFIFTVNWLHFVPCKVPDVEGLNTEVGDIIAPFILCKALRHGSQFYLQIHHACLSFVSVNHMASPITEVADIELQLTTNLSTPTG